MGQSTKPQSRAPAAQPAALTFVPYYAWDNRKAGAMAVWVRSAG